MVILVLEWCRRYFFGRKQKHMFEVMWILHAVVLHLLLLGSIFVIYFRSPVITGLKAQAPLTDFGLEPPAKRLVLIVTDGLRAQSFFDRNCSEVPHIRELILKQGGLVGVSHSHVPTESRPGHIALIAGLYEDPSAVTRGWKENPIDFDTVFNRSHHTYAFGANDVLHIFSRLGDGNNLSIDSYNHELDFSGSDKTYELDRWVYKHVRRLLQSKREKLANQEKIVFFLHLLGLDTAGHVHKPGTELFLENLHDTDRGISEMYETFEQTFPDKRTAYILTSDHGMSNAGSHGAGDPLETETPFYIWGSGIAREAPRHSTRTFQAGKTILPLHEIEQAQIAPLMSALLGIPPPTNNFGYLPYTFLNVSEKYRAYATHSNALQLLEQFETLLHSHKRGVFSTYLPTFKKLTAERVEFYKETVAKLLDTGYFAEAVETSYTIMLDALEGTAYFQGYYSNVLLLSTTVTFVAWIFYLVQLLLKPPSSRKVRIEVKPPFYQQDLLYVVGVLLLIFVIFQRVPLTVAFYLLLPISVLRLSVKNNAFSYDALAAIPMREFVLIIICSELLVCAFFTRKVISVGYLCYAFCNNFRTFPVRDLKFYTWLLLVMVLACFPLLPPSVGYKEDYLLFLGTLLTLVRPFVAKSRISRGCKILSAFCLLNATLCFYQHSNQMRISIGSQIIAWAFSIQAFITILLNTNSTTMKQRIELIFFNLTCIYVQLCTSYEAIFIVMLSSELMLSVSAQQQMLDSPTLGNPECLSHKDNSSIKKLNLALRLAFTIILYTFFSFFGTGNIASISSFDPNIVRCYLSTFAPFLITALVIFKLILPVVLNISIIFGLSMFARDYERQIFLCVLLICDIMGLNFLFMVHNTGSWLEIGSSISHFVIMEVTTLVLLVLTHVSKFLLRLDVPVVVKTH